MQIEALFPYGNVLITKAHWLIGIGFVCGNNKMWKRQHQSIYIALTV